MKTVTAAMVVGSILLCRGIAWPAEPDYKPGGKTPTLTLAEGVEMKLVLIPAGTFTMGSPADEKLRQYDETQHEVTISKPFYMGRCEVTVDQFAAFVKDSGYKTDAEKRGWSMCFQIRDGKIVLKEVDGASWRKPGFEQKGDHPVVQVSWNDAAAFCDWLSKKSGKTVQLPTEAQWEYACRAGSKTAFPWGDSADDGKGRANCADQTLKKELPKDDPFWGFFRWNDGFVFTSPVGSFEPNAFGLHDMVGNAREWCRDWYEYVEKYPAGAQTDPSGPATGAFRVQRGRCWYGSPVHCRSAYRMERCSPGNPCNLDGFRVVVSGASVD